MSKSILKPAALALAAAAGTWGLALVDLSPLSAARAQETTTSSAVALAPDMILGAEDAPVTVVEYASYTCPHCRKFHETVFGDLKANYIETGKVKLVYREIYFDKYGLWAAMVARCGGPEKYFAVSDMIYDTQEEWLASGNEQGITDALRKLGISAGLTGEQVDACLNDKEAAKAMVAAFQQNATADEVEGTPTFIINGEKYSNMGYDEFSAILDEKLAE